MIAEADAFKALLVNDPWDVFDPSDAVLHSATKPTRYLCVYDQTPLQRRARLSGPYGSQGFTFALMHVAQTAVEVRRAVERTRLALERQRLLGSTPLRLIDNGPILRDSDSITPRLYSATDVWRCVKATH